MTVCVLQVVAAPVILGMTANAMAPAACKAVTPICPVVSTSLSIPSYIFQTLNSTSYVNHYDPNTKTCALRFQTRQGKSVIDAHRKKTTRYRTI